MSSNPKKTESDLLEQYRVALENVKKQPQIATTMVEYGYDDPTLAVGKNLWEYAQTTYENNKLEDDETSEAKQELDRLKAELSEMYWLHRKKARVVFRDDMVTLSKLELHRSLPDAYAAWLEAIRKFYTVAQSSDEIKQKMLRLKVTDEELSSGSEKVTAVEGARADYLREVGESQDATKVKDKAITEIAVWMREFYDVARIALEDNPQLLETLGLKVRS